jgi:hypothetical protein
VPRAFTLALVGAGDFRQVGRTPRGGRQVNEETVRAGTSDPGPLSSEVASASQSDAFERPTPIEAPAGDTQEPS